MAYSLPLEFYQEIEQQYGKDIATKFTQTVQNGLLLIEEEAQAVAVQKKMELKDELTKELVTKAEFLGEMKAIREEMRAQEARTQGEFKAIREEIKGEFRTVREEMKTQEARFQGEMKLLNLKLNFLIGLMILALTIMNPVMAEVLKRWLKL
jgi:hypothetical protein